MKNLNILYKGTEYLLILDDSTYEYVKTLNPIINNYRKNPLVIAKKGNKRIALAKVLLNYSGKNKILYLDGNTLNLQLGNLKVKDDLHKKSVWKKYYSINASKYRNRAKEWVLSNPDKAKKSRVKYSKSDKGRKLKAVWRKIDWVKDHYKTYYKTKLKNSRYRYLYLIRRAKERNLDIDLTLEDYIKAAENPCVYCEAPFNVKMSGHGLDRMDNSKGYLKSNVKACCTSCNKVKNSILTYDEMKVAMKAVLEYRSINVSEDK